jgi:hypothetical protein
VALVALLEALVALDALLEALVALVAVEVPLEELDAPPDALVCPVPLDVLEPPAPS